MAQIEHIRYLHEVEGWSTRRIAREFHVSRKTIRKSLDRTVSTEEPRYTRTKSVRHPKMGLYQDQVDAWLLSDRDAPAKQRHTARRIFERLRDECGADVVESTVRAFVAERRRELAPKTEAFLHLVFAPAEAAQVDWGDACIDVAGERVKVHMFCMRLAYSTTPFVMLFPSERMECFLEGHVRAFSYMGGIPRRIIYDNLRSAVTRILAGHRRKLNSRFEALKAHYLFEADFANPASGWEKGLVEDLVGTARRTFLVPVPEVADLEEANAILLERLMSWRQKRPPLRDGRTVGELWDEERPLLRELPPAPFRASTPHSVGVSGLATVQYQGVTYSVPAEHAKRTLRLEAFHDHIEVYDGRRKVAEHQIRRKGHRPVLELDHYLDVLVRKPGAVRNARVVSELGDVPTAYRDAFLGARPQAYREFVQILMLSRHYTLPAVLDVMAIALRRRIYDVARVERLLDEALGKGGGPCEPVQGPRVEQTAPSDYDALLTGVKV